MKGVVCNFKEVQTNLKKTGFGLLGILYQLPKVQGPKLKIREIDFHLLCHAVRIQPYSSRISPVFFTHKAIPRNSNTLNYTYTTPKFDHTDFKSKRNIPQREKIRARARKARYS